MYSSNFRKLIKTNNIPHENYETIFHAVYCPIYYRHRFTTSIINSKFQRLFPD